MTYSVTTHFHTEAEANAFAEWLIREHRTPTVIRHCTVGKPRETALHETRVRSYWPLRNPHDPRAFSIEDHPNG